MMVGPGSVAAISGVRVDPSDDDDVESDEEMVDVALDMLEQAEMSQVWVQEMARLCAAFWRAAVESGMPKGLAADLAGTWLESRMAQEITD
jgi:hypothetical protein